MQFKIAILVAFLAATAPAFAVEVADADAAFAAYNSNFYTLSNGFGFYKENTAGGRLQFWTQAEQIEMLEDYFDRTHTPIPAARKMIPESIAGFTNHFGADWSHNKYNDDIAWMTIACARGLSGIRHPFISRPRQKKFRHHVCARLG